MITGKGDTVSIQVEGFDRIIFNKREIRAAIRAGAREVQREARRLIARRAISQAGDFPGYDSGAMSRSIKIKMGTGGGYAKIMPYMTPQMSAFYPAFLEYGTNRGLKPRRNFMVAALDNKRTAIHAAIAGALARSLEAR